MQNFLRKIDVDLDYEVDPEIILTKDGKVPLIHWPVTSNFGDALSPWLFQQISGLEAQQNEGQEPTYVSIGSIINRVTDHCIVWGTGSFGPEPPRQINNKAKYLAVRGPLTRARILDRGAQCPRVYGDPALLTPLFFDPKVEKTNEIGLVLRWSDDEWLKNSVGPGVKLINLGNDDVETILAEMLSCKRIVTSSLHGLVIADAYGIPSAWLSSTSPKGREFKFYDYFLGVGKVRHADEVDLSLLDLTAEILGAAFSFDDRELDYDPVPLLDACPLIKRIHP